MLAAGARFSSRPAAAGAVLVGVLVCSCNSTQANAPVSPAPGSQASPVKVAQAAVRSIPLEIATTGNAEPLSTIVVRAQIGGALNKVLFEEGQMVKAGDTLYEIDPRPFEEAIRLGEANQAREEAQLKLAEANLTRAQAQAEHYGKQAERYEKLAEQGIFSREQADQAAVEARARRTGVRAETANIESVKAAIRADQAAVANARLNLAYCTIKAPISGRTGSIRVKAGNIVKANDTELVTIHQIQPIYITFTVPEEHLARIRARKGRLPVSAAIPGETTQTAAMGTLTFLDNAVDNTTGTIRLKATFANQDARFWPGQFVDVRLRLEDRPNVVAVPAAAVQTGQQGNYVYVVKPDSSVELRTVSPGARAGSEMAVNDGLAAGETVVTEGHLRLVPGAKVKVLP